MAPSRKRKATNSPTSSENSSDTELIPEDQPDSPVHPPKSSFKQSSDPQPEADFIDNLFRTSQNHGYTTGSPSGKDNGDDEPADTVSFHQRFHNLEQESISKDLIIGNLQQDLENKTAQIAALQTNLSSITSIVLDLQKRLSGKFPDEFPVDPAPSTDVPTKRAPRTSFRNRESPPPDQLIDEYLNSSPKTVIEKRRRKERGKVQKLKHKKMMFIRNSNPSNQDGNHDQIFVACGDPFTDIHGDRSGVARWGYDENLRMFFVTRKSLREEHFKYRSQQWRNLTK